MNLIILINFCQNLILKLSKSFTNIITKNTGVLKKSYKRYKLLDETVLLSGISLVAMGTIAGGITLNPVILGAVNGAGVVVAGIGKKKNYKRKIELSRIAFTTYDKVLVELGAALRGYSFNKQDFIERMKLIDEMIIDQTPLADRFSKKYTNNFS